MPIWKRKSSAFSGTPLLQTLAVEDNGTTSTKLEVEKREEIKIVPVVLDLVKVCFKNLTAWKRLRKYGIRILLKEGRWGVINHCVRSTKNSALEKLEKGLMLSSVHFNSIHWKTVGITVKEQWGSYVCTM